MKKILNIKNLILILLLLNLALVRGNEKKNEKEAKQEAIAEASMGATVGGMVMAKASINQEKNTEKNETNSIEEIAKKELESFRETAEMNEKLETAILTPLQLDFQRPIQQICSSGYSSLFLTDSSQLFFIGTLHDTNFNKFTQLASPTDNKIKSLIGGKKKNLKLK